jgi:hypothetical protein
MNDRLSVSFSAARAAAKLSPSRGIQAELRPACQISQLSLKKSLNVAFSGQTGAEGQQSQCLRDLGGAA